MICKSIPLCAFVSDGTFFFFLDFQAILDRYGQMLQRLIIGMVLNTIGLLKIVVERLRGAKEGVNLMDHSLVELLYVIQIERSAFHLMHCLLNHNSLQDILISVNSECYVAVCTQSHLFDNEIFGFLFPSF